MHPGQSGNGGRYPVFHHWFDHFAGLGSSTRTLEVIRRSPLEPSRPWPLLFVHGAYTAAWCWDEHFLPYFAALGYDAQALSLRGHGGSDGKGSLHLHGIGDYVEDVESVVDGFDVPPVVIGHSMGGLITQKLMERHALSAAVLLASVPPSGLSGSAMRLSVAKPFLFSRMSLMQTTGPAAMDIDTARRVVFSETADDALVRRHAQRMQQESQRALMDMTLFGLPFPSRARRVPTLVLSAGDDVLFSREEGEETARAYGADFQVVPGIAHAMMLEPEWERAAAMLAAWLQQLEAGGVRAEAGTGSGD